MKIVMGSGVKNDPKLSIALVQHTLASEYNLLGHEARSVFGDDYSIRIKRITELEFSLKCAFDEPLFAADVLDFKVGDGLYSSLRSQALQRNNPQLLVSRSHGLDFINYENKVRYAKQNNVKISWREKAYVGGYLLWQVHNHMRLADVCLFLNDEERDYAVGKLKIAASKSHVVDNGIPQYLLGLPRAFSEPRTTENLRIAVIGTYVSRKINIAPTAINTLLARHPGLSIGFLGTIVEDSAVYKDYDPASHNRITTVRTYVHQDLPKLLADYDVLLFPSMADGFGLVVFEAMACGLGVIASDLVALTGRMNDAQHAVFFERMNPDAIVSAVERIIQDPALLLRIQTEGYALAQHFSWRRVAEDTLAIYHDALSRKRARS